jgi:hypothetical protein
MIDFYRAGQNSARFFFPVGTDEGVRPQGNMVAGMKWFISRTIPAVLATGLLSCGLFCQQAGANQINGSVLFSGAATVSGGSGPGTTTISFANPSWTVVSGLGNYSTFGTPATFTSFSFTGTGTGATLSGPGIPQGTFTLGTLTYSFDLLALVNGITTSGTMALSGTGIAHITGLDDTPISWTLAGSGNNFTFDLSGSNTTPSGPTTVPEGGSAVSLLGMALVGLEALRRRLRSA